MNSDLINLYIEKLIINLTELTKVNILQAAQLELQQKINADLARKVDQLDDALTKAKSKNKKNETDF